jgi:hypothetical protein
MQRTCYIYTACVKKNIPLAKVEYFRHRLTFLLETLTARN